MIEQFGGASSFYRQFYINSPFPLAIVRKVPGEKWLNCNYYDYPELFETLKAYMIVSLKAHISLGIDTSNVYILGKKNAQFIQNLNDEAHLFKRLHVLDHPRYIQQYKSKEKQLYIDTYLNTLKK